MHPILIRHRSLGSRTGSAVGALVLAIALLVAGSVLTAMLLHRPNCPRGRATPPASPEADVSAGVRAAAADGDGDYAADLTGGEVRLGYMSEGGTRTGIVAVRNSSNAPVSVLKARTNCGCLTITDYPRSIAAGGVGRFHLTLAGAKAAEDYASRLFIQTDRVPSPLTTIVVRARVGTPLEVLPGSVDLGMLQPGQEHRESVTIRNHGDTDIRLVYGLSTDLACRAIVGRDPVPAGGELNIPLVVKPDRAGRYDTVIRLRTDHPAQRTVALNVRYVVAAPRPTPGTTPSGTPPASRRTPPPRGARSPSGSPTSS